MAPLRRKTILVNKEVTFDKLFRQPTSNIFDSSTDREAASGSKSTDSPISPTVSKKTDKVEDAVNNSTLELSWLNVSDIGPVPDYSKTKKKTGLNRIKKRRKSESCNSSALNLFKNNLGPSNLPSSTPNIVFEMNKSSLIKITHYNHIGFPGLSLNDSTKASEKNVHGFPFFIEDAVSNVDRTECMTERKLENVNMTKADVDTIDCTITDNHTMQYKEASLDLLDIDINRSKKNSSADKYGRNETGRSSCKDDSTKHSSVREAASRLCRSRRLSRKSRESESKLNVVMEESDSESTEAEILQQVNHIVLPSGKKYRRSLTILKHLDDEDTCTSLARKGRHYDLSVKSVINMQSETGTDIRDGRKSLMNKRMSLLSQCQIKSFSPAPRCFRRSLLVNTNNSFPALRKRLSVAGTILEETVRNETAMPSAQSLEESFEETSMLTLSCKLRDLSIQEEDKDNNESKSASSNELDTSYKSDVSKLYGSIQETAVYEDIGLHLSECTFRTVVLRVCQQDEPISFSNIFYGNWQEGCVKIGEGAFGEVFLIPRENAKNVIKIIPIEGDFLVNGEKQKKYHEICNELLIADSLSDLREENEKFMSSGFAELVSSSVIKGRYPERLIELWNEFDESKGSDNESPEIFGDEQLYLVLELRNAGKDLESYSFSTAKQALSVLKQTVCALAVAELNYEFEHRDLHWGNVLVSRTLERGIPFVLDKERHTILAHGVKATIIDFTLSRIKFPCCNFPIYCDIGQDPDMFIGTGDYQFCIYRCMRDDLQNNWHWFVPQTNVRWLHYLVDKMINEVKYQRKSAKVHKESMKVLIDIESWVLSCDTSVEVARKILKYKQ